MCVDLNLPESHRSYVIQKPEARLPRVLTLGTEDICEIGASPFLASASCKQEPGNPTALSTDIMLADWPVGIP